MWVFHRMQGRRGGRVGRPLLWACAAFAAGAYVLIGNDPGLGVAVACCATAVAAFLALRSRAGAAVVLCAALGALRGGCAGPPARDAALDGALLDPGLDRGGREPTQVEGLVLEAERRPRALSVLLRIERLEARPGDEPHVPRSPPLALVAVATDRILARGARVRLLARLREPPRALNPGERDRRADFALRGIAYQGSGEGLELLSPAPRAWQLVADLRARFVRRCAEVCTTPGGAGLALAASAGGRRTDGLSMLCMAACTCALIDPASTHDLALQLSVAGVAGMLVLSDPLRDLLPRPLPLTGWPARAVEWFLGLGCATAAATLFTAPLIAAAFHRVSLATVAANTVGLAPGLLAIPLASLAVPAQAISPPLALPLFWAADHLAGVTLLAARLFAALPYARVAVAAPAAWTALLWWAGALLLAGVPGPLGPGSRAGRPAPRTRLGRAAVPLAALLCLGGARAAAARLSGELRVTFLAVGQGDAAVLQLPGGGALLVDGGGDLRGLAPPGADVGTGTVLPALAELGVSRLDAVVLTHPHPDHAGGLFAVLDRVPVGELWMTGEPGPGSLGDLLRAKARERSVPVRVPGPETRTMGGARVEVLRSGWSAARSTNDNSIVLRVVHGTVSILLAGDVEALAEAELAQSGLDLRSDLLKAGHHGSRTSTTDAFLRAVHPSHVVFSVGAHNPFGFPHLEVADRVRSSGAAGWRTDRGAVTAVSDGRTLQVTQR